MFAYVTPTATNDPHDRIDPVIVHRGRIIHFAHTRRSAQSDGTWYASTVRPRTTLCGQPCGPPGVRPPTGRRTCFRCMPLLDAIVTNRHTMAVAPLRVAGIDIDTAGELADILIQTVLADPVTAAAMSADHAPQPHPQPPRRP